MVLRATHHALNPGGTAGGIREDLTSSVSTAEAAQEPNPDVHCGPHSRDGELPQPRP
jgi:hypothetical protein